MKKTFLILSILTIIISSCVTSLQPIVTYQNALPDSRLEGTWEYDGQKYLIQKLFNSDFYEKYKEQMKKDNKDLSQQLSANEKNDSILYSKSYMVKYTKDNLEYHLFGSMTKLNGRLFLNLTPADLNSVGGNGEPDDLIFDSRLFTHTIARLEFTGKNAIKLDFIDGGFLYDQIKAGRLKIKNVSDELYDTFLITASTSELQQFLEKYGNDDRFFNKENSVTLNRKS